MRTAIFTTATAWMFALGCAGTSPPPTQQLADVQSANRSATELGAQSTPEAKLHLKLAEEQLQQANVAIKDEDNARAESLLTRAKADAELAIALTRERKATADADMAIERAKAQRSNANEGGLR